MSQTPACLNVKVIKTSLRMVHNYVSEPESCGHCGLSRDQRFMKVYEGETCHNSANKGDIARSCANPALHLNHNAIDRQLGLAAPATVWQARPTRVLSKRRVWG